MEVFLGLMVLILAGIYVLFGWWACNRTIFWNTGMIGEFSWIIGVKFSCALFLGWCLIPIAVALKATGRR